MPMCKGKGFGYQLSTKKPLEDLKKISDTVRCILLKEISGCWIENVQKEVRCGSSEPAMVVDQVRNDVWFRAVTGG